MEPPPRYGNWNGNVELAMGANHPSCGNPYYEYYQRLIRQHRMNQELERKVEDYKNKLLYYDQRESNIELNELVERFRTALTEAYEIGRKGERERIEQVFKEEVPPHGLSLEDSVWLKRILNKAFH